MLFERVFKSFFLEGTYWLYMRMALKTSSHVGTFRAGTLFIYKKT